MKLNIWLFLLTLFSQAPLAEETKIVISLSKQQLYFYNKGALVKTYPISTGRGGIGNLPRSGKTPVGKHLIIEKIGAGAAKGTVFTKRRATGKIKKHFKGGALITSRILRLRGLSKANRFTEIRGLYIHGTSAENRIGKPASGGCIRMKNDHIISLFNQTKVGTVVEITR
jgi:lipoprotein-anchoring transpeptidase ErfK/SrfK